MSDISNVNEVEAFNHLPVIEGAEKAGCPRPQYLERLVRSPEGRCLLARAEHRAAARSRQGAGARHRRLARRCAGNDPELHGDEPAAGTRRCITS